MGRTDGEDGGRKCEAAAKAVARQVAGGNGCQNGSFAPALQAFANTTALLANI